MTHLSDEQFETLLAEPTAAPAHLEACAACRAHLAEARVVRQRLRRAFEGVHAPPGLRERLIERLENADDSAGGPAAPEDGHGRILPFLRSHRRLWPALAAAVLMLAVLVPTTMQLLSPATASAAQELVAIHRANLDGGPIHNGPFYTDGDPCKVAEYLRQKLGFAPAMPECGAGMSLRGCCVAYFRGEIAGSYVVETPQGPLSIIVLVDEPESLGMNRQMYRRGRAFRTDAFARNRVAAVRMDGYTYCAVGELSHEALADILAELVPADELAQRKARRG